MASAAQVYRYRGNIRDKNKEKERQQKKTSRQGRREPTTVASLLMKRVSFATSGFCSAPASAARTPCSTRLSLSHMRLFARDCASPAFSRYSTASGGNPTTSSGDSPDRKSAGRDDDHLASMSHFEFALVRFHALALGPSVFAMGACIAQDPILVLCGGILVWWPVAMVGVRGLTMSGAEFRAIKQRKARP